MNNPPEYIITVTTYTEPGMSDESTTDIAMSRSRKESKLLMQAALDRAQNFFLDVYGVDFDEDDFDVCRYNQGDSWDLRDADGNELATATIHEYKSTWTTIN